MAELLINPETQLVTVEDDSPTISVLWDQAVQQAVINTSPGPTIASRAYGIVHTAIFDAWAAYDLTAIGTQLGDDLQRPEIEVTDENKQEAISYAAYRVLENLFPSQFAIFDALMADLGYDRDNTTTDATTPAGIGNVSAQALLDFRQNDGSNELGNAPNGDGTPYLDIINYQPVNSPDEIVNIELWTPEFVPIGDPTGSTQQFLTPQWGAVIPFALDSGSEFRPVAPEPFLLVDGTVDLEAQTITLEDGSVLNIDSSLIGSVINPEFINQANEVIEFSANLTDEQKLIAEFWEDGGGTSFPPGTWMSFGQFVSARDENSLDDDVKLFFSLGNAVFDAGIATWEAKVFYDYTRPVRAIRELGELGLIGEFNPDLGGFAIEAWQPGEGTQTILATDFLTYQTPGSDPSPPFAEYTSGHSSFSAAGAQILNLFTGSDEFGASVTFAPGESRFEPGITPAEEITLDWETFSEAADEAGVSRLYGGIHFDDGDLHSRSLGTEVGNAVFEQAQFYINGGVASLLDTPIHRLQSSDFGGNYIYTGEEERHNIPTDFAYEGIAFNASVEAHDDLIALYRFQSNENPGSYLLVGESERSSIQNDADFSQAFREEGLAFYVYGVDAGEATEFYRFRNLNIAGSYLYVTGAERENIIANYSNSFVEEGIAFEANIV
ncbi:MAG: vanadium-dependent haloperoxidase [Cyanobacteria bacterium P01_F01_bin.143]